MAVGSWFSTKLLTKVKKLEQKRDFTSQATLACCDLATKERQDTVCTSSIDTEHSCSDRIKEVTRDDIALG